MALDEQTESNHRSLHWAPLRSWNLFSGGVRSRFPQESRSAQLSRSQSVRNNADGGQVGSSTNRSTRCFRASEKAQISRSQSVRNNADEGQVGSSTSRSTRHFRASESNRKRGAFPRRDNKQTVREGNHRHGEISIAHDHVPLCSCGPSRGRHGSQYTALEASDDQTFDGTSRPSEHIAHHQQHHHHDHHHHHYHYHRLYRHPPRRLNGQQGQGSAMPSVFETASSSHFTNGISGQRRYLHDLEMPMTNISRVGLSSHNTAIEARDRLDEILRGASFQRDRHNTGGLPGGLLDDFSILSILFDDEGAWSNDEIWELGTQEWLSTWGYRDGHSYDLLSPEQLRPANVGLSKTLIENLPKESFQPKTQGGGEETRDTLMEQVDCAVCLERFLAGQLLIRLPCEHRFHPDCLTPWLESHGQCPYCRSKIGGDSTCEVSSRPSSSTNVSRSHENLLARMRMTNR